MPSAGALTRPLSQQAYSLRQDRVITGFCHSIVVQWIHSGNKVSIEETAKELPQGCRPDPICWCTDKLEELLEQRNEAWEMAMTTNN